MNLYVDGRYAETTHRLAQGFEPIDALRGGRVPHPVRIEVEGPLPRLFRDRKAPYRRAIDPGDTRPTISRHDSCRHALLYQPSLADHVDVRIYDHARRYVPRRLRVPLLTVEEAESRPAAHRVRRPGLLPGTAYDVSERTTGLRGRVLRGGLPMRWVRVEARLPGSLALVGSAQGDDRGEFLLLPSPEAAPFVDLSDPLELRVSVSGPAVAPVPADPDLPTRDPLWDLPLEELPPPGDPDPVSAGETFPVGFVSSPTASRIVPFRLGRILSGADGIDDFDFTPP